MKIVHKLINSTMYVGIEGELDESGAAYVRENLDKLFLENKIKKVIIDLENLSFMDSTGIGMLIGRYKKLKTNGVPLFLASPNNVVDKVLRLSGIYEIMPLVS